MSKFLRFGSLLLEFLDLLLGFLGLLLTFFKPFRLRLERVLQCREQLFLDSMLALEVLQFCGDLEQHCENTIHLLLQKVQELVHVFPRRRVRDEFFDDTASNLIAALRQLVPPSRVLGLGVFHEKVDLAGHLPDARELLLEVSQNLRSAFVEVHSGQALTVRLQFGLEIRREALHASFVIRRLSLVLRHCRFIDHSRFELEHELVGAIPVRVPAQDLKAPRVIVDQSRLDFRLVLGGLEKQLGGPV
mmetsp:Transcript_127714/g.367591  ORF Transcript_127714/g.367591 Transcript_127714/m.367591 type:complete len:246 (-) Transcript_127714:163-900(-)